MVNLGKGYGGEGRRFVDLLCKFFKIKTWGDIQGKNMLKSSLTQGPLWWSTPQFSYENKNVSWKRQATPKYPWACAQARAMEPRRASRHPTRPPPGPTSLGRRIHSVSFPKKMRLHFQDFYFSQSVWVWDLFSFLLLSLCSFDSFSLYNTKLGLQHGESVRKIT